MATLTIPPKWQPSHTDCLKENDWWIWTELPAGGAPTVLGNPNQATCYPPGWAPAVTYEATQCPSAFTSACRDGDSNVVTCCPTAHEFKCRTTISYDPFTAVSCSSLYAKNIPATVLPKALLSSSITTSTTAAAGPSQHLYALGILYTAPTTTALETLSSDPIPSPTPSSESSSGVSVAAVAGASVGAAVGGFILASLLIACLFKRKRRTETAGVTQSNWTFNHNNDPDQISNQPQYHPPPPKIELGPSHIPSELATN